MKEAKRICCLLVLFVFLSLPVAGYTADTSIAAPEQTVTMQLSQYNRLKEIINRQDMTLETLQTKLTLLGQDSTADKQTLMQLQDDLMKCKAELTQTQELLTTTSSSLNKAEVTLQKQNESLMRLTNEIKAMEHKQAVLRRQRDMWAVVAGSALLYSVLK